jgi:hypothetical protein
MKVKAKAGEPLTPAAGYRQAIQKADEVIAQTGAEIRSDNWQQLALEWFASREPERSEFARFIGARLAGATSERWPDADADHPGGTQ